MAHPLLLGYLSYKSCGFYLHCVPSIDSFLLSSSAAFKLGSYLTLSLNSRSKNSICCQIPSLKSILLILGK